MRALLGFAVLSFGVSGIFTASAQPPAARGQIVQPPSSVADTILRAKKGDRLAAPRPEEPEDRAPVIDGAQLTAADSEADAIAPSDEANAVVPVSAEPEAESSVHWIPLDEFCEMIVSSARANDLPVVFFTNLIWQESRFNPNSISRAGAQGVAQFMPETAAANGLDNPFNPFQAVPASARLLHQLHDQFGNVGLAAAAYNAGPGRVMKWLSKRAPLPRETRAYVATITGRPAEHWRAADSQMSFKPAADLPCSRTPAFAEVNAAENVAATAESSFASVPVPTKRPIELFVARSKTSTAPSSSRLPRRLARSIQIKSKPVQLTLVASEPEPGQATTRRHKRNAAFKGKERGPRHVRVASTSP